jgi:hypothetical protein
MILAVFALQLLITGVGVEKGAAGSAALGRILFAVAEEGGR